MASSEPARPGEKLICRCFVVPEEAVRRAIREKKLRTVEQVTACTRAAGGCSSCYDDIAAILAEMRGRPRPSPPVPSEASKADRRALVVRTYEEQVRSLYKLNGLEMEILDVHGDRIFTRFRGRNVGTQLPSILTLKRYLVTIMSAVCGQKMQQIEVNVLEGQGVSVLP